MGLRSPVYTFWAVRDEIERAASAKYDQTPRSDYEVIEIEERDLNISGAPAAGVPRCGDRPGEPPSSAIDQAGSSR